METKLQNYYESLIKKLSTRSYNLLARNNLLIVRNIIPWVMEEADFRSLKGCGSISEDELTTMCEKIKEALCKALTKSPQIGDFTVNVTLEETEPSPESKPDTKKHNLNNTEIPLAEYLLQSDIEFVNNYFSDKGELPLFYILQVYNKRLRNANSESLYGDKSKIRQFIKKKEWSEYSIIKAPYVYSYRFHYGKLCTSEHIEKEQLFSLLALLGRTPLYVCPNSASIVKTKPATDEEPYYELLVNEQLNHFRFRKMIKEVKRLNELRRTNDHEAPISTLFSSNPDYWNGEVPTNEETINDTTLLIEEIIKSVFGEIVEDHKLVLKKTHTDYRDVVYQILKETGHRMHISDIFEQFKLRCPECNFKKPEQIRYYLSGCEQAIPVGKTSTFALKEWGEMVGSIRELALKILNQQNEPVPIAQISREIQTYRPDSSHRSITTIIQQCVEKGEIVLFFGDRIGLPSRAYDKKHLLFPRTFEEWLALYKHFVEEHGWHPLSGSSGLEGYLYRWAYHLNHSEDDHDNQKQRLTELRDKLSSYPRTTKEIKFLRDCENYKQFVTQNGRMVELWDDPILSAWFKKWIDGHKRLTDGRKRHFENLLSFLTDTLGDDVAPQTMTTDELRFIRNCNAYKQFVQQKGRRLERTDDPILFTWFDNCTHKYNSLNRKQQDYFDELLGYLVEKI